MLAKHAFCHFIWQNPVVNDVIVSGDTLIYFELPEDGDLQTGQGPVLSRALV
jgi:hypothetical protein